MDFLQRILAPLNFLVWEKYIAEVHIKERKSKETVQEEFEQQSRIRVSKKAKKTSRKDKSLEDRTKSRVLPKKKGIIPIKDNFYNMIKHMAFVAYQQQLSYSISDQANFNLYEADKKSASESDFYRERATIREDDIRDILEDMKFKDTFGMREGSGKHIRPEARQRFEDYKLLAENVAWVRVKYDLSLC